MALFGYSIARVRGNNLGPNAPDGSIALFRDRKGISRGDIVLVDHPELGRIVKKVSAVGRNGNVHLRGTSRSMTTGEEQSRVPRELVRGVWVWRLA